MRLVLETTEHLREVIPQELPLFVRISATDWVAGGWDIQQSIVLCQKLKTLGVDLVDVSSGGTAPDARIPVARGYQIPFAQRIRDEAEIRTGGVGLITDPQYADEIITSGAADRFHRPGIDAGTVLGPEGATRHGNGTVLAHPVWLCSQASGEIAGAIKNVRRYRIRMPQFLVPMTRSGSTPVYTKKTPPRTRRGYRADAYRIRYKRYN